MTDNRGNHLRMIAKLLAGSRKNPAQPKVHSVPNHVFGLEKTEAVNPHRLGRGVAHCPKLRKPVSRA